MTQDANSWCTAGRHNIGLQAGDVSVGNGVFIDGLFTGLTGIPKRAAPTISFGTHKFTILGGGFPPTEISDSGLRLFEKRSYRRCLGGTARWRFPAVFLR